MVDFFIVKFATVIKRRNENRRDCKKNLSKFQVSVSEPRRYADFRGALLYLL